MSTGQATPGDAVDLDTLKTWVFDRVLSESSGSIYLLGTLQGIPAIAHLQRSPLPSEIAQGLVKDGIGELRVILENSPYFSSHALLASKSSIPDLVLKIIWPATETHIKKYTAQERAVVVETPEKYRDVVVPYIESFPESRIQWVYNILAGKKEADRVLWKDDHPELGFLILPDLKWDQSSMSDLYLTVLVQTRQIHSLRDLKTTDLPLLYKIRSQTHLTVEQKFGVKKNKIRMFVHYQPSYYHFHVHVVHIDHEGLAGMTVGQAHLLDDLISLLELSPLAPAPSLIAQMTLTYALGVEHGLYAALTASSSD